MGGEQAFDEVGEVAVTLVDRYRTCSSADLAQAYADLAGAERAIMAQRLAMVAVLDEREAWRVDGARDTAGWVAATDAVRVRTGKAVVSVARALSGLPAIAALVEAGGLSFDQLVPLCELATPDTDDAWAEVGAGRDPGSLAAEAERARRVEREAAERQRRCRSLRAWRAGGGGVRGSFFLPDADAEAFLAGIDRLIPPARPGDAWEPLAARRADALVDLAWLALDGSAVGGRAHVYVHAQAGVLGEEGDGWVTLADGTSLSRATLERLGCDATTQLVLHDETGAIVGLGSVARTVPRRVRRLLAVRDRCCRFPGCEATLGLHAHHLVFWSEDGPTEPSNLALLCHRHHHLVHEAGWTLAGDPEAPDGLVFTSPAGRACATAPRRCPASLWERLVPEPPAWPDDPMDAAPEAAPRTDAAVRRALRPDAVRARVRLLCLRQRLAQAP